ncbi:T6SS effector amidase Tae4 family protein [Cronobacter sakazakii]|uniref:T6SS effector amidase Tae4 family protein n=1 Tax=Cronobacter sakazakii TaxID=28141 RepID=UPI003A88FE65
MKPLYAQLKMKHYSANEERPGYVLRDYLFNEIGYDSAVLIKSNSGYMNTCAVRMSLALIKCNVNFEGRLTIINGPYKGKKIEPGAKLLADQLYKANVFGKAEIYTDIRLAGEKLRNRKGVVFFNRITNYNGGHIDLLEPVGNNMIQCNSECYTDCKEIWFWELK